MHNMRIVLYQMVNLVYRLMDEGRRNGLSDQKRNLKLQPQVNKKG